MFREVRDRRALEERVDAGVVEDGHEGAFVRFAPRAGGARGGQDDVGVGGGETQVGFVGEGVSADGHVVFPFFPPFGTVYCTYRVVVEFSS